MFWRGDPGMVGLLASRISGSADIYQKSGKEPLNSINFITCHDGFTLNDLVSYNEKHNEANGEGNCDGTDQNYSFNYGVEGATEGPHVEGRRIRQIKNFIATLFLSRGVPLFLGGDEFRRTQQGNNNAFCQDNETSWYDWKLMGRNREIFRFTQGMIAFRKKNSVLREVRFYTEADIAWFSPAGSVPDWDHAGHSLACLIHGSPALFLMFHAADNECRFVLPSAPAGAKWHGAIDTSRPGPEDVYPGGLEKPVEDQEGYTLPGRSLAVLLAR
jgi:glycogen operon protein